MIPRDASPKNLRYLYLHGFGSGPNSAKGVATAEHYARLGVAIERLDLRLPSLEHLRVSAMIDAVRQRIGGEDERAVIFGSSLGGLVASRVAEGDGRVVALVLLAPAFGLIPRWKQRLGEEAWARWEATGWHEVHDYTTGKPARVDFDFIRDLERVDPPARGFPDVRVPTLIVHGVRDDVVDIEGSRMFSTGRPHVRLVEVADGHELIASVPRILTEADAFLAPFLGGALRA
ncbi:YqiA/YcfP family alpha/beta fold hydrolase [Polyangium aurulentum]|uniref:YqiA/YcfP family alpha/beta fold hydrolase n=1 Tax=Polyangium aurulentum TaxID=2567896 RepID=UPI0010ADB276|nr:YqiA/YcfP family alpha/beta fold hydrolase [Polyangium aurulentum]UQA59229.1 alpha/beta fold hydrolase [Polyangium aurulentum]